jgi:hypothetical protein
MNTLTQKIQNLIRKGGLVEMKKFLFAIVLCATMLSMTAAHAGIQMYLSVPGFGNTDLFDRQVVTTVDATSHYAAGIFTGASFNDTGDLQVGAMTLSGATISNTQGLGTNWELTGRWDNLAGNVVSIDPITGGTTYSIEYTSGDAYLFIGTGATKDVTGASFGGIGSNDDNATAFTNGLQIAHLSLVSGNGALDDYNARPDGGFTLTNWKIVSVPTGVWFDQFGNDMKAELELYGFTTVNTLVNADVSIVPGSPTGLDILSRNTGDAVYNIPEPTSIILLGSGLLGLAGFNFKRKRA